MAAFRAKPLMKEAVQFDGFDDKGRPLFETFDIQPPRWLAKGIKDQRIFQRGRMLFIRTLEGTMKVQTGSYVVKGIRGEIYPCEQSIFEASYEMLHPRV